MIRGVHGLFYSTEPEAARAFFRDKVKLPGVDIGQGWWIFDFVEGDIGVHPVEHGATAGEHNCSFYCDDIHGTVAAMRARGVEFLKPVEDHGYGFVTYFKVPGGLTIQLYEPKYSKGAKPAKKPAKSSSSAKKSGKKPVKKTAKARR